MALVGRLGIREGVVNVFSMHTTCSVFINETQTALIADIRAFLETVVDRRGPWRHNDPAYPIAIARTPIRICARSSSATASRCR